MAIKCCQYCKPPKRYAGCGDHCPEYQEEKAKHLAEQRWLQEQRKKEIFPGNMLGDYPVSHHIIPRAAREGRNRHGKSGKNK